MREGILTAIHHQFRIMACKYYEAVHPFCISEYAALEKGEKSIFSCRVHEDSKEFSNLNVKRMHGKKAIYRS